MTIIVHIYGLQCDTCGSLESLACICSLCVCVCVLLLQSDSLSKFPLSQPFPASSNYYFALGTDCAFFFFSSQIWWRTCGICLSAFWLTGLFLLTWCPPGPSILLLTSRLHFSHSQIRFYYACTFALPFICKLLSNKGLLSRIYQKVKKINKKITNSVKNKQRTE